MKIRNGFVSNSSSSSFMCDVCGTLETGYDGEYDCAVSRCVHGHEWCSDHENDYMLNEKQKILLSDENYSEVLGEEKLKFIREGSKDLIEDMFNEYKDNIDYETPEAMCPVCNLTSLDSSDVLTYVLKQSNTTLKEVEAEIRNKCNTLEELRKELAE